MEDIVDARFRRSFESILVPSLPGGEGGRAYQRYRLSEGGGTPRLGAIPEHPSTETPSRLVHAASCAHAR
jgi:hypothetical protein